MALHNPLGAYSLRGGNKWFYKECPKVFVINNYNPKWPGSNKIQIITFWDPRSRPFCFINKLKWREKKTTYPNIAQGLYILLFNKKKNKNNKQLLCSGTVLTQEREIYKNILMDDWKDRPFVTFLGSHLPHLSSEPFLSLSKTIRKVLLNRHNPSPSRLIPCRWC